MSRGSLFKGKTVIITGGASGLGSRLMDRFIQEQAHPISIDIKDASDASYPNYICDVKDAAKLEETCKRIRAEHGSIDIAIANAGIDKTARAQDLSSQDWQTVIATNLIGATNLISAVYPEMIARNAGQLCLISSGAGLFGFPTGAPYTASKAGLIGLAKSVRAEAKSKGVKVSVACPPILETPLLNTGGAAAGVNRETFIRSLPGGIMSADRAAQYILNGLARNKAEIIFPLRLAVAYRLAVLFPALGAAIRKDILNRFEKSQCR